MREKLTLFDIALDILDRVIGGKRHSWTGRNKTATICRSCDDLPKKITRIRQKLLELISNVSKVEGYKISIPK